MNAILLMGSYIGNNVIVGAGSVVHGTFPDNVVIAGNPARIICSLEKHYQDRKEKTVNEAILCAQEFYKKRGRIPKPGELGGFKFLFCPRNESMVRKYKLTFNASADEETDIYESFMNTQPYWDDYQAFLKECGLPVI